MKTCIAFTTLLTAAGLFASEVFHFDFKDADGKSEIRSGKFVLRSDRVPLLVQKNALRLASTAEVAISGPLPELRKEFTVSAWILKKRTIDICPILSRGGYGDLQQFVFTAGPELFTRQGRWERWGITTGNKLKISAEWKHITGVFSDGEYRVYVDGRPFASSPGNPPLLPAQDTPLVVGAEKNALASMNYTNADMLLNDLRLYDHALTGEEIAELYAEERTRYPVGQQIPAGSFPSRGLDVCFHYDPGDPDFKNELALTRSWCPETPPQVPIQAEVQREENAAARLYINEKEYFPYSYYLVRYINHDRYELNISAGAVRDFSAAGVPLCRVYSYAHHPYIGKQWAGDGQYDFRYLDDQIQTVLKENPAAELEINLQLNEPPPWFAEQFPDEMEKQKMADGSLETIPNGDGGLLGSDIWKGCSERYLQAAFDHVSKAPYADHVYSFMVSGGKAAEWYWPGTFSGGVPGYSAATRGSYRNYLKKKGIPGAETAEVPSPEVRQFSETLMLRDPQKAADVLNFRRFLDERTFECIRDAIRLAKKAGGGKRLTGTYSGYSFGNLVKHHLSGHNNFGRIVRLPELDYIQLAIGYGGHRALGNSALCVNPYNGSSMLHGKLLLHECDVRTPLYTNETQPEEFLNRTNSIEETVSAIERNTAMALTRGDGLYEMLLSGLATYHNEEIMNAVKRNADLTRRALGAPRRSAAEVAVVYDEESDNYFAWPNKRNTPFFSQLTRDFYYNSPRAGLPVDFYTLEDMVDPRMRPYKCYIFLNAIAISPEMRTIIRRKLDAEKATAVWCYAPGFISDEKFDAASMEALTGIPFDVSLQSARLSLDAAPTSPFAEYVKTIPEMEYGPVFIPKGDGLTIHATAGGNPSLVEKKVSGHTAIYTLSPLNHEFLRTVAERSGAHIWLNTRDIFSANERFILIHATDAGEKTVSLPGVYDVLDAFTGKELFKGVSRFTVDLPKFGNGVYEIRRAEGTPVRESPEKYWDFKKLESAPAFRPAPFPESQADGLQAVLVTGYGCKQGAKNISGPNPDGLNTKTEAEFFAYIGIPDGPVPEGGFPGVVLIHGDGGTAYPEYTRFWVQHGYAVIALDWYNQRPIPRPSVAGKPEPSPARAPLPGGKRKDHVANVANAVLAHSLLRSLKNVNPEKTAFVGLSFGSWYGAMVAAVDPRFKGGVEIYCGDVNSQSVFINGRFHHAAKIPLYWVVGTNDRAVKLENLAQGFKECPRVENKSVVIQLPHHHNGFCFDSALRMANHFTQGETGLPKLSDITREGNRVSAKILDPGKGIQSAVLCYNDDSAEKIYHEQKWKSIPAKIENDVISAELPPGTRQFFLSAYEEDSPYHDLCGSTTPVFLSEGTK